MTAVATAVTAGDWERTALLLALGLSRLLARLPQGTAEDLLSVLEDADDGT